LRQATLVHLSPAALAKEEAGLFAREEAMKQRETQIKQREEALRQREQQHQQQLQQAQAQLASQQSTANSASAAATAAATDPQRQRQQDALVEALRRQATAEKNEARSRLSAESLRLGTVYYERHGASYQEMWQDGFAFRNTRVRQAQYNEQKDEIEREKKALAKRKASVKTVDPKVMVEIVELKETLELRLITLKKDMDELVAEEMRLNIAKDLHVRELKRCGDEDRSRFNNLPLLPPPPLPPKYLLLQLLGKGGFSEVYKAYDLQNCREVACKIHQLNTSWNDQKKQNYLKHAIREYEIHKSLNHPKVVRLFDVFEIDSNSFCTVLEYCDGTDLDWFLKTHKSLNEREARAILLQIFAGLKYLSDQKRPIIHYDLKPGNILFHRGEVKITDFGLSKIMEENESAVELTSQGAGTYWYLPPECFETGHEPPRISNKVDVWSAGVILYQMLFAKKPFGNGVSQHRLLSDRMISRDLQLEIPAKPPTSKEVKDFLRKLLQPRHELRPDVNACVLDEYLRGKPKKDKEGGDGAVGPAAP
jgi:tousled-like kinase